MYNFSVEIRRAMCVWACVTDYTLVRTVMSISLPSEQCFMQHIFSYLLRTCVRGALHVYVVRVVCAHIVECVVEYHGT